MKTLFKVLSISTPPPASAVAAKADDLKIALICSQTGTLDANAKQTETDISLDFEYAAGG